MSFVRYLAFFLILPQVRIHELVEWLKTPVVTFEWLKIPVITVVDFYDEKRMQWLIEKRNG